MGALLDEIEKYLGAEGEPIVYRIDAGAIKFFADSLMDPDPQYGDEDYAKVTRHGGAIAPPTFYGGATSLRNLKAGDPRTMQSVDWPRSPEYSGVNAGDDFELVGPIRPGDTLTCREKLADAYEKQGRSGHLIFVTTEKTFTNQQGKVVLIRRVTSALRRIKPSGESHE